MKLPMRPFFLRSADRYGRALQMARAARDNGNRTLMRRWALEFREERKLLLSYAR